MGRGERAFHDKDGGDHPVVRGNCVPKCGVHNVTGKTWPQAKSQQGVVNNQINVLALFLLSPFRMARETFQQLFHLCSGFCTARTSISVTFTGWQQKSLQHPEK